MSSKVYYKLARPDGWDFYTGKTINYRESIGKVVKCPNGFNSDNKTSMLCTDRVIHASETPEQCFIGAKIPCSVYRVEGKSMCHDSDKHGFKELKVLEELQPEKVFRWNYAEACNPVHPFKIKPPKITKKHKELLKQWTSIYASIYASICDSIYDSIYDSICASICDSICGSIYDSIRGSIYAYTGYIFKDCVIDWKYTKHKKSEYPFQCCVDLWKAGLVPSYDGKVWRLHGGKDAKVLYKEQ